jgi:hypothetical protein
MTEHATEVLRELMNRQVFDPLPRVRAEEIAESWRRIGIDNGLQQNDLDDAAGIDLASYLLRTFGEDGQQLEI